MPLPWGGRNDSNRQEDTPLSPNYHSWWNSPWTASHEEPTGIKDEEIFEIAEQVHWGQYEALLSMLPYQHQELGQDLTRAGLWEATRTGRSLSRGRRCSHVYSSPQVRSPLKDNRRKVARWQRGDSLMRSSWAHSRHSRSRASSTRASCQGTNNQVRYHPGSPIGEPLGMSCLPLAHHAQSMQTSDYTTLWADFTCSHSNGNSSGGGLVGYSQKALRCTP